MKTKIVETPAVATYPCLKIKHDVQCVVLFTGRETGVCLIKGETFNLVGTYSGWAEHLFEVFNGTIEVSN